MKKIAVFIVMLMLFATGSNAQWQQVAQVPAWDIYSLSLVDGVLYAGTDSVVYISTDDGETWNRSGQISGSWEMVEAVTRFNGKLFLGTTAHGVFTSSDNGVSWQQINTGLIELGALSVTSFVTQSGKLIAGTQGAGTYVLNSDLQSWTSFGNLPLNISGTVYAMTTVGDTVIAGAGANGYLFRLSPDALEWTEVHFSGGPLVPAVAFAWLGGELFAGTTNGVYRSTNNGAQWTYAGNGLETAVNLSLAVVGDTLFAIVNRLGEAHLYESTNRGGDWVRDDSAAYPFTYALKAHGNRLFAARQDGLWYRKTRTTSVDDRDALPAKVSLFQNYPNPFNPVTTIRFQLPHAGRATLRVFNMLGEVVATLVDEEIGNGIYAIPFEASTLSSGVYLYSLKVGNSVQTKRLTLVK